MVNIEIKHDEIKISGINTEKQKDEKELKKRKSDIELENRIKGSKFDEKA